jgi:polysaccharide export outer membrane protein
MMRFESMSARCAVRGGRSKSGARRIGRLVAAVCFGTMAVLPAARAADEAKPETGPGVSRPAPTSAASTDYVFVPGDVLEITVQPQKDYDRTVTVQPDGKIVFPIVGEVTASGMTVATLTERLQSGLAQELKRPRVTVSLKEINRGVLRRVSVLGAVKTQGVYELKEQATLAEMLATAGGATPVGDLKRVTITRADGSVRTADLSTAARTGQVNDNLKLEPGDLIFVPEGVPATVLVLGEVQKQGSFELAGEMRVLDVLSQAGGPSTKADLSRLTLTRAGEKEGRVLDLQALLTKGQQADLSANLLLQPGDTLVVPESERKFYVLGEVTKADAYPLKEGARLLDAITTAGGSSKEADLGKVMLIRRNDAGQAEARKIDLKKMMKDGKLLLAQNEPLQEGDVIFVPDRKPKQGARDILSILYPLSGLVNLLRF